MRPNKAELRKAIEIIAAAQRHQNGTATRLVRLAEAAGSRGERRFLAWSHTDCGDWLSSNDKDLTISLHPWINIAGSTSRPRWEVSHYSGQLVVAMNGVYFTRRPEDSRWQFGGTSNLSPIIESWFAHYPKLVKAVRNTSEIVPFSLGNRQFFTLFRAYLTWHQQRQNE